MLNIIKSNVIYASFCSSEVRKAKIEENAHRKELLLVLLNCRYLERTGQPMFKNAIKVDGTKIYIEYFSELLRIGPNFYYHLFGIGDDFLKPHFEDFRQLRGKKTEELQKEFEEKKRFLDVEVKRKNKPMNPILLKKLARFAYYRFTYPTRSGLKTIFLTSLCLALICFTLNCFYMLFDKTLYPIVITRLPALLAVDALIILLWVIITLRQIRPTKYEFAKRKENG